jgi:hypothetical protein
MPRELSNAGSARWARAGSTVLAVAIVVGLWCLAVPRAQAYAWMIRHGETQCASCHTDPSGGELLTRYGRLSGTTLLPMDLRRASETQASGSQPGVASPPRAANAGFLWGAWDTPPWLLLGGSLRGAAYLQGGLSVFPMQSDLFGQVQFGRFRAGGSLGVARLPQNSPHGRAAFVTRNQGDAFNLISRSHWVALDLGKHRDITLRAGRLNLPFGLRIPEHTMWVRDLTRTDRDADQQHGVALAASTGSLRGELMALAGNYQIRPDRYRERGYAGYLEWLIHDYWTVGASSLLTVAHADRVSLEQERTVRGAHGLFGRLRPLQQVVLVGEVDLVHTSRRTLGYVAFGQLDYEPLRGLHLIGTAELADLGRHDPGPTGPEYAELPGSGKPRAGAWASVNWFFYRQLDLRVDGIFRQDAGATVLAQLHAYL